MISISTLSHQLHLRVWVCSRMTGPACICGSVLCVSCFLWSCNQRFQLLDEAMLVKEPWLISEIFLSYLELSIHTLDHLSKAGDMELRAWNIKDVGGGKKTSKTHTDHQEAIAGVQQACPKGSRVSDMLSSSATSNALCLGILSKMQIISNNLHFLLNTFCMTIWLVLYVYNFI